MSTERIDIVVTEKGSAQAAAGIKGIGDQATTANASVEFLKSTLQTIGAGLTIAKMIELADAYATTTARLRGLSKSAQEYQATEEALFQVAQRTRQSFDETANLFGKLKTGTENLSYSNQELVGVTETLNKIFANSGASAEATKNAIIQMSQGLGAGALRGEELNSVMEATQGEFGRVLKSTGLVTGSIKDFAEQGKLTSKVLVEGLIRAADDVNSKFATVPVTVNQAFTVLGNALERWVGQANAASGATSIIANAIILVADNIGTLANALITAGVGFAAFYTSSLLLAGGLDVATIAMAAFNAVAAVNPFVLIATAVALAVTALYTFAGAMNVAGSQTVTWGGLIRDTFRAISLTIQTLFAMGSALFSAWAQGWGIIFNWIGVKIMGALNGLGTLWQGLVAFFTTGMGGIIASFVNWLANLQPIRAIIEFITNLFTTVWSGLVGLFDLITAALGRLWAKLQEMFPTLKRLTDLFSTFGETVKDTKKETETFGQGLSKNSAAMNNASGNIKNLNGDLTDIKYTQKELKFNTDETTDSLNSMSDVANHAFGAVVIGAGDAVDAVGSLRDAAAGVNGAFGMSSFGSGGQTTQGLSNASKLGSFTIIKLPEYNKWLSQAGASPIGMAGKAAGILYGMLQADSLNGFKGDFDPAQIAKLRLYRSGLNDAEKASLGGVWDYLQKFRDGGSMMVGGDGGTDSTLVALRATAGERVDVKTRQQQEDERKAARGANARRAPAKVEIHVHGVTDPNSFNKNEGQLLRQFGNKMVRALTDG